MHDGEIPWTIVAGSCKGLNILKNAGIFEQGFKS